MQHFRLTAKNLLFFTLSMLTAYHLTSATGIDIPEEMKQSYWWIFCCGVIAISAMLLPGISGSYMLQVLGMYSSILSSLVAFVDGISSWQVNTKALFVLLYMGSGIAFGALFFSRAVNYLLLYYKEASMACLTGFSFGALRAIWPFWTEEGNDAVLPSLTDPLLWISFGFFLLGIVFVLAIERFGKSKQLFC